MSDGGDLVRRDAAVFFHQEGSSPCIAALRYASGMWIEDAAGNRHIDLHGDMTAAAGPPPFCSEQLRLARAGGQ